MQDTIKVHVVKYPDRDNLVMRYRDPFTGRQVQRSTRTASHKEAVKIAAKWEDDLHNGRFKVAEPCHMGRIPRQVRNRSAERIGQEYRN